MCFRDQGVSEYSIRCEKKRNPLASPSEHAVSEEVSQALTSSMYLLFPKLVGPTVFRKSLQPRVAHR